MKKNLKLLKSITCILGITFLVMGMVPFGKVEQAAPEFTISGIEDVLSGDKLPNGELCDKDSDCDSKYCDGTCQDEPTGDDDDTCTPAGTEICPTGCGLDASTPDDGCGGTVSCPATDACADDDDTCSPTGEPCSNDADCCSGNICAGEGICKEKGEDKCKEEGQPCGGANQCCSGLVCGAVDGSENEKCYVAEPDPICGDGEVNQPSEQCDDGNLINGDGCSDQCQTETAGPECGDGNLDDGEQCDDGNLVNGDGCSDQCLTEIAGPECGDGNLDDGEQCDDGNLVNGDGCSATCLTEQGGDDDDDDDDDDPEPGGGGTPTIIPVTGVDLMVDLAGLQQLFTFMGLAMIGTTMVLEGVDRKISKRS